jgi:hypothetical protein
MSEATVQAARERSGMGPAKATRTFPIEQGGCPACGHMTYDSKTSNVLFCPCEDCHSGGLVIAPGEALRRAS